MKKKKKHGTLKHGDNSEINFGVTASNSEMRALAERIRECAKMVGSGDALAQKAAIPRRTLETYLSGDAEPKTLRLVAISRASDVHIEWLATGNGPKRVFETQDGKGKYVRVAALDRVVLQAVLQVVEEIMAETNGHLAPEKKAELILLLYEEAREREGKVDRSRVLQLVKLAS